jgi:hypothetical protein
VSLVLSAATGFAVNVVIVTLFWLAWQAFSKSRRS